MRNRVNIGSIRASRGRTDERPSRLEDAEEAILRSRRPIREHVTDVLADLVTSHALEEGEIVSVAEMARRLNVSATPVREALVSLEQHGLVVAEAGRGFRMRGRSEKEFLDIYHAIAGLECLAIDSSPAFSPAFLRGLRDRNERFKAAHSREDRIEQDLLWHEILDSACHNHVIVDLLAHLRLHCRRYEYTYMASADRAAISADLHERIIDALERRDRDEAKRLVTENWLGNIEACLNALRDSL